MIDDSRWLTKRAFFPGVDTHGNPLISAVRFTEGLTKVASLDVPELHAEITSYVRKIVPGGDKLYVLVNALGAWEWWGCFPEGTRVRTATGEDVPVEELASGDTVVTHTGAVKSISAVSARRHVGLIRFRAQGEATYTAATPDHPYLSVKKDDVVRLRRKFIQRRKPLGLSLAGAKDALYGELRLSWSRLADLQRGDYVALHVDRAVAVHPELDGLDVAELLGWYMAEGCTTRKRRHDRPGAYWAPKGVVFTLGTHEPEAVERVVTLCRGRGWRPRVLDHYQGHNVARIELGSPKFARICNEHVGKGAKNKRLSAAILRMPTEWQRVFLDAYLRGDGHAPKEGSKEHGCVIASTASVTLASDLRRLSARLGMVISVVPGRQHHTTWAGGHPIYAVRFPRSQLTGSDSRTESFLCGPYLLCPIKDIEVDESWAGDVYNLDVDDDHSYVADGLVVHNCNLNGDAFREAVLANEDPDNGYRTFLRAGVFRFHKNTDPTKSMGRVVVSVYNWKMHRVELLLEIDRRRATELGHQDLIDELDNGGHPSVSMGMKTPYDTCTRCGHRSKTDADRCRHIREEKGRVCDDGVQIGMDNPIFRAFDISFVLIGADRASFAIFAINGKSDVAKAKVPDYLLTGGLKKVASFGTSEPARTHRIREAGRDALFTKISRLTGVSPEDVRKLSMLEKRTPIMKAFQDTETSIPSAVLAALGTRPLAPTLSSLTASGIVLQPREFQHLLLTRLGQSRDADELDRRGQVFGPTDLPTDTSLSFGPSDTDPELLESLAPMMSERSLFAPFLQPRVLRITITRHAEPLLKDAGVDDTLAKISAAYDGYLGRVVDTLGDHVKKATCQNRAMLATIHGDLLGNALSGLSKTAMGAPEKVLLLGVLPAMYLLGRAVRREGDEEGVMKKFVKSHPVIAGSMLLGLLRAAGG